MIEKKKYSGTTIAWYVFFGATKKQIRFTFTKRSPKMFNSNNLCKRPLANLWDSYTL